MASIFKSIADTQFLSKVDNFTHFFVNSMNLWFTIYQKLQCNSSSLWFLADSVDVLRSALRVGLELNHKTMISYNSAPFCKTKSHL